MTRKLWAILSASIFLVACHNEPVVIDSGTLNDQFKQSTQNSAVSWWYLGEKDNVYFIVEKDPLKKNYYKIDKENAPFKFESKKLTFNEKEWVNIKSKELNKR